MGISPPSPVSVPGHLAGTVALGDREGAAVGRKDDLHPGLRETTQPSNMGISRRKIGI